MVFSSLFFLFYFLPLVLLLYFVVKKKYKNTILLLASLFFYSWGEPRYIWIMLFSTVLDYTCGKNISKSQDEGNQIKAKMWLLISIASNLSLLIFFKYSNFIIENLNTLIGSNIAMLNITLPIGISFYTFQTMSYTIDVYRKEAKAQGNFLNFSTYVTLFPQLIAGPIVRYQTVAKEIDSRKESYEMVSDGIQRFIIGLGKKVILANSIGMLWREISQGNVEMSVLTAWLGIVAFAFQIYFDFSGYSDMAIGLGKIFGFNFLENFNYPYMANSITDFWRRWHISLGVWFKEYVYIPLGGNKKGIFKQLRNIMIVWLLTGIWHGASWNYVLWGLLFTILLILEKLFILKLLDRIPNILRHIYTLFFVLVSWVLFSFESMTQIKDYLGHMFALKTTGFTNPSFFYYFKSNALLLIILFMASTNIMPRLWNKYKFKNKVSVILLENMYLLSILLITISYLVNSTYNPFLYFKF